MLGAGHKDEYNTILSGGSSEASTGSHTSRSKLLHGSLKTVEGRHKGEVVDLPGRAEVR